MISSRYLYFENKKKIIKATIYESLGKKGKSGKKLSHHGSKNWRLRSPKICLKLCALVHMFFFVSGLSSIGYYCSVLLIALQLAPVDRKTFWPCLVIAYVKKFLHWLQFIPTLGLQAIHFQLNWLKANLHLFLCVGDRITLFTWTYLYKSHIEIQYVSSEQMWYFR